MAGIDFDLKKFLPKEFQDSPFAQQMADTLQTVVADKVMASVNTLLRARDASTDTKGLTVQADASVVTFKLPDLFYRDSLKLMISGNKLVVEDPSTITDEVGTLINISTSTVEGSYNSATREITVNVDGASPANIIDVNVLYATEYDLDFEAMSKLRRSLGLHIDTTGFQDEASTRRMISDLPYFYQNSHSKKYVQYLSFVAGIKFDSEELYAKVNEFPQYGMKRSEAEMQLDGFNQWAHEATISDDSAQWGTVPNDVWYKTSHVRLEYDDETFFEGVDGHVNLFQKITKLFYQLAPVQLVLETIVARRTREHNFKIRATVRGTDMRVVGTDPASVTGVNIT